ncbi:hypothetical protein C8Q74DRAFT_1451150 [Fomes fomentarius]|nr:hypothetical protein C8Q74DRAFT_1451150 [Fomes fomentarius]
MDIRTTCAAFRDVGRNVSQYPGSEHYALQNISFRVPAGKLCVRYVGVNGSGKSTILKLVARLYHVEEGHILLDGLRHPHAQALRPPPSHLRALPRLHALSPLHPRQHRPRRPGGTPQP